jgi:hypothetical protein
VKLAGLLAFVVFAGTVTACSSGSPGPVASGARHSQTPERIPTVDCPSATAVTCAGTGSISGGVGYPSEFLPAQDIYAISTDGSHFSVVETVTSQTAYVLLGLTAGDYFVLTAPRQASIRGGATTGKPVYRFGAGYTRAVLCGLSVECTDHTLVPVHVTAEMTVAGVDPTDWYNTDGYQVIPPGGPPPVSFPDQAVFPDLSQAGRFLAPKSTTGQLTEPGGVCPTNIACVWLTGQHVGHAAGYLTASAGSNGLLQSCAFYLFSTSDGWRSLNYFCRKSPTPFPAVGSSGRVVLGLGETGCVNVHSAPAISSKVVACLKELTAVRIDDGPYYVPSSSQLDIQYWWHIAGRGWMVHRYLMYGG